MRFQGLAEMGRHKQYSHSLSSNTSYSKISQALICVTLLLFSIASFATEMYRYKDKFGNWVFTDRKPKQKAEKISVVNKSKTISIPSPRVFTEERDGQFFVKVENNIHAPVELKFSSDDGAGGNLPDNVTVPANTTSTVYQSSAPVEDIKYRWLLGDPKAMTSSQEYLFPVISNKLFRISQSFRGKFSHYREPNLFAVDIAMEIGTKLAAARSGTIIWVKDDYHMGAAKQYFLDKANMILILHEDGTYATYGHILQGSAVVKAGDEVTTGQHIAMSGTSGFSSGPHLHFVISKNNRGRTQTSSFNFITNSGKSFRPQRGMKIRNN